MSSFLTNWPNVIVFILLSGLSYGSNLATCCSECWVHNSHSFGGLAWFWGGGQTCLHLQELNQVLALPDILGPLASSHPLVLCECRILPLGDGLNFSVFAQDWLLFLISIPRARCPPVGPDFEVGPTGKSLGHPGTWGRGLCTKGRARLLNQAQGATSVAFHSPWLSGHCSQRGL